MLAARHGRLEPVPRGAGRRRSAACPASPGAARARLDRSGAGRARSRSKIDLATTLFIVSSKSGSTLEPNIFKAYFFERVKQAARRGRGGAAASSPSPIPARTCEKEARGRRLPAHLPRRARHRRPLLGAVELRHGAGGGHGPRRRAAARRRRARCSHACAPGVPADGEPGPRARHDPRRRRQPRRCDKLTLVASPGIHDLGAWLEQLVAESTGKDGKGIIPVDRERARAARRSYGDDRAVRVPAPRGRRPTPRRTRRSPRSSRPGKPVVAHPRRDAVRPRPRSSSAGRSPPPIAGAVIGINPFNQPDVEASKIATRPLTTEYEKTGTLPAEAPFFEGDGVKLFADAENAEALERRGRHRRRSARVSRGAPRPPRRRATTSRCSPTSR